ncbi:MAG: TIGR02281 family clan AA aspartic protease [Oxalobacter sp.]|nr:MAG: TIGR02281 family clan AA aspartic protease [Oxalobacter sp.]
MRRILFVVLTFFCTFAAQATDVSVVGLFPGKALLVIDGGNPRTYSVGATIAPGVKLVASNSASVIIDFNGKREELAIGQHVGSAGDAGGGSVTLHADRRGHFIAEGQINGGMVRMLVDTGASLISLPSHDAIRLGIDYRQGQVGYSNTANGMKQVYLVRLDTVKVGSIVLHQVDASVSEGGLPIILLGMSFLNRTEMQRSGDKMTLKKLY